MTHSVRRLIRTLGCLLTPILLAPGPTLLAHLAPARAHLTARASPAATTAPVPVVRLAPVARPPVTPVGWTAAASRRWRWPLAGRPVLTRRFDPPATRYGAGHRGVDLAGAPGQPVLAAGAGSVRYAGDLAGRGVVAIEHDGGLRTTYEPVRALVTAGQRVAAGTVIGRLDPGHAGCPAPACLHWGLRRGDTYLDPLRLLTGQVRLLPLDGPGGSGAPDPSVTSPTTGAGSAARVDADGGSGGPGRAGRGSSAPTDRPAALGAATVALAGAALGGILLLRRRGP
jgi:Peptidase family M23